MANTLYEYYTGMGQALPSIQERSKIYEQQGLGSASTYAGTYDQNVALLGKLSSQGSQQVPANLVNQFNDIQNKAQSLLNPTPQSFNLQIPETLSSTDVDDALSSPTTTEDIITQLKQANERIRGFSTPTEQETQLSQQLADIRAKADSETMGLKKYVSDLPKEGISQRGIQARSIDMERNVNLTLERMAMQEKNLLARLGIEQTKRTEGMTAEQTSFDNLLKIESVLSQQKTNLFNETDKLTDNARQALNTILTQFKGVAFDDLDTSTQLQIQSLAQKQGIPIGVVQAGMNMNKAQLDLNNIKKAQEDTTNIPETEEPMTLWEVQTFTKQYGWTPPYGFTQSQLMKFMQDNPGATPEELEAGAKQALAGGGGAQVQTTTTDRNTIDGVKERIKTAQDQGYTIDEIKQFVKSAYTTEELFALAKQAGYAKWYTGKNTDIDRMLNALLQ